MSEGTFSHVATYVLNIPGVVTNVVKKFILLTEVVVKNVAKASVYYLFDIILQNSEINKKSNI